MIHLPSTGRRMLWLLVVAQVLVGLMLTSDASAANRRFCFRMRIFDSRPDDGVCPRPNQAGALRGCTPSQYRDFFGGVFELWDRDTGQPGEYGGDDLIGTYVHNGNHENGTHSCVTFNWEGSGAQVDGEQHPDLYIIARPQVMARNAVGPRVEVRDDFNQPFFPVTYRDYAVENCTNTNCWAPFYLDLTWNGMLSWELEGFDILDNSQHMLEVYGSLMGSNWIYIHYQNAACSPTANATALDRNNICMNPGEGERAVSAPHELGHVLQMRLFGQDYLRDVFDPPNVPHYMSQPCGTDSCATTEGWADYVAVRSWWDPQNTNALPFYEDLFVEPVMGTPQDVHVSASYAGNRTIEGQVARAFWDLDDALNEGPRAPATWPDSVDLDTIAIAQVWDNFGNGTGNLQDYESDNNGVNLYDYYYHGPLNIERATTLLSHNCLSGQDQN